ncbi:MAG: hypothetical protein WA655_04775 [Candidatus Korobacteraceae bacterium]
MSNDDKFEAYWLEEDDWLVTICPVPEDEDDPEVNLETLNWIGRLFGFATATNTRVLALVGDPELPAYEILFSFDCMERHEEFLRLVEADGYADASEFTAPSRDEIGAARPLGLVFPGEQAELITGVGVITMQSLTTDASNSDA